MYTSAGSSQPPQIASAMVVRAQSATLDRILRRAAVPRQVCDMIPEIVSTCNSWRTWSKPPPASAASVELADTFSQQVERDLLFVYRCIIFHLIDQCTRRHAACLVQSAEEQELIDALDTIWVGMHGPMRDCILDVEAGLASSGEAKQ